ncbi:CGNR zinc finger domain-containing protein [soil metagenome]
MKLPTDIRPQSTEISLDAGDPALDFANTLDDRNAPEPTEGIPDYQALLAFAFASGLIDETACDRLAAEAAKRPYEAVAIHASALALREAIYEVAAALVEGISPATPHLNVINRAAAGALAAGELVYEGEGFRWRWDGAEQAFERPTWSIADAAIRLLTQADLSRLRICAADDCGWVFLDETRNRSRKWCDMNTCGNRAKVARYRQRRE